jgi:hypothetical protein
MAGFRNEAKTHMATALETFRNLTLVNTFHVLLDERNLKGASAVAPAPRHRELLVCFRNHPHPKIKLLQELGYSLRFRGTQ